MGADPGTGLTPPIGIQIKNLVVYCVMPSGSAPAGSIGIRNQWAQENSIVENVEIQDAAVSQLDIENGGHLSGSQNSGPYTRIHAYAHGGAKCLTYGTLIPNSTQGIIKGFRDWTCSGSTTTDVAIDGSNATLENFHVESPSVDAVAIGVTHAVKNVNVMGLDCLGNSGTNCVHIGSTSNTINVAGIHSYQFTNLLKDDGNSQSSGTIPQATEAWLSFYSRGYTGIVESTSSVLTKTIGTSPVTGISGNTPTLASTTGSLTSGNFSSFDASGNVQDSGVSVNSCATLGRCAWWGSSIQEPQTTETTATFGTVTQAKVFGFYLPMRTTVSTVGITTTAGDTAATCDVGIYDSTGAANSVGQLKFHVNGGWDCHTGSTTASHALSTTGGGTGASLTIGPGYYFLAYCTSSTAVTFAAIHNAYQAVTNVNHTYMGTVANGCSSGVLQPAPGAITYSGVAPIGAFFEP